MTNGSEIVLVVGVVKGLPARAMGYADFKKVRFMCVGRHPLRFQSIWRLHLRLEAFERGSWAGKGTGGAGIVLVASEVVVVEGAETRGGGHLRQERLYLPN